MTTQRTDVGREGGAGRRAGWAWLLMLASMPAVAQSGMRQAELDREQRYVQALMESVERQWNRPSSVPLDVPCRVEVVQIPGGEVISVEFTSACPYDVPGRASVEHAVLKASPLPYRGFEDQFRQRLLLNFRASDTPPVPARVPPAIPADPPPDSVDDAMLHAHWDACRMHLLQARRAAGRRDTGRSALVTVGLDGVLRAVLVQPSPAATADEDARWARALMSLPSCAPMPGRTDWGNAGYGFDIEFPPVP